MTSADPAIIRAARAKITPEGAWTQGAYARDARGVECSLADPSAVSWCLRGAIFAAGGGVAEVGAIGDYIWRGSSSLGSIAAWNDDPSRTHAEVLAAMDGCADALEQGRL